MPTTALHRSPRPGPGKGRNLSAAPEPKAPATSRTPYKVTGIRVLRSEWANFWSLRSTWITLGVAVVLLILFGAIASYTYSPDAVATGGPPGPGGSGGDSDAVSLALTGVSFAQLAIGGLGVLLSEGEYSTGMIRSTLAAVPRRLPVGADRRLGHPARPAVGQRQFALRRHGLP